MAILLRIICPAKDQSPSKKALGLVTSSLQAARITHAKADLLKVNKKVSSLFKPKASLNVNVPIGDNEGAGSEGCDLSYG